MNSALGRTWRQARQELFSPEEIAASEKRVNKILKEIDAKKEISEVIKVPEIFNENIQTASPM